MPSSQKWTVFLYQFADIWMFLLENLKKNAQEYVVEPWWCGYLASHDHASWATKTCYWGFSEICEDVASLACEGHFNCHLMLSDTTRTPMP